MLNMFDKVGLSFCEDNLCHLKTCRSKQLNYRRVYLLDNEVLRLSNADSS
jgi:hypothetical protein